MGFAWLQLMHFLVGGLKVLSQNLWHIPVAYPFLSTGNQPAALLGWMARALSGSLANKRCCCLLGIK